MPIYMHLGDCECADCTRLRERRYKDELARRQVEALECIAIQNLIYHNYLAETDLPPTHLQEALKRAEIRVLKNSV